MEFLELHLIFFWG